MPNFEKFSSDFLKLFASDFLKSRFLVRGHFLAIQAHSLDSQLSNGVLHMSQRSLVLEIQSPKVVTHTRNSTGYFRQLWMTILNNYGSFDCSTNYWYF